MELTQEQAYELALDGTLDIGDGMTLRFREEPDEYHSIDDDEGLGKVACIGRHDYQRQRPDGFDGMAEKISTQRDTFWWQPPDDLRKGWVTYEHKKKLRQAVQDILNYGYQVFVVELCKGTDAYGRPIVIEHNALGGIEPFMSDDDKGETVRDIVYEMNVPELVGN
jgi:hypothetical protein